MSAERSPWNAPEMVAGFAQSPPNAELMRFAQAERVRAGRGVAIDIGCGAARNLVPLAQQGWDVVGFDSSHPMLVAAAARVQSEGVDGRIALARATMEALPVRERCADLIVAHGIWNLAASAAQFRRAVREAARAARPGAGLFVFTFSRNTFPATVAPVAGEPFVFTEFAGAPQCFLTAEQLIAEMRDAGFELEPSMPMREYNRRPEAIARVGGPPVIYEAAFRFVTAPTHD